MAEASMADLHNLLAATAEAKRATAEAGQINVERISEINSSLEKLMLAQQEGTRTTSRMGTTLDRVLSTNTALDRSVADLRQSMERVVTRLTSVEAIAAKLSTNEQPSGRRSSHRIQGVGTGEDQTSGRTLIMASPSINFNQFLEKEKLKSNGSNFTDWFHHVRILLNGGNLQYVLDAPLGAPPAETESDEVKNVYETRKTRYSQVQCAILCSLEADLQKRFEHHDPYELVNELRTIFETHAVVECYEASKHFFSCMMEEGNSVSEHMVAMSGHAKKLSDLGIVIPNKLGINRVLQSLPPSYKNFVMNYNMQNMNKELPELFSMLKSAEIEIQKEHQVLMVNKTTSFKKQGKPKKGNVKK
ncbi:hypothetical protein QYE76_005126 [Lolium multiflorum]|uniref:Uncharacterized protein n=1 Tax=Lolium multiflorum TaxID=4521 RepID=A0AAD8W340_LOLMU|nr:hypothetical protein QYE76_005126 [Lolium multiflorum]